MTYAETAERNSWGHPNFRASKKTFVTLEIREGRPSIALRLEAEQVQELLREPEFFATPYGRGQWISRYLDGRPSWTGIRHLIDQSYRRAMPQVAASTRRLRNSSGPKPKARRKRRAK